jgi:hypothetical protein
VDKARAGQPLQIGAAAYNRAIEAGAAWERERLNQPGGFAQRYAREDLIRAVNDTGGDRDQWDVVEIGSPVGGAPDSYDLAFQARTPSSGPACYAILTEPVASSPAGVCDARISGITPARVWIQDTSHRWARIEPGQYMLVSCPASEGYIPIAWQPGVRGIWVCVVILTDPCTAVMRSSSSSSSSRSSSSPSSSSPSSPSSPSSSSSPPSSSSSPSIPSCPPAYVMETLVNCVGGRIQVSYRQVALSIEAGCLTKTAGAWSTQDAGCCDCGDSSSSSGACVGECAWIWEEAHRHWHVDLKTCTDGCNCDTCPDRDGYYNTEHVFVACVTGAGLTVCSGTSSSSPESSSSSPEASSSSPDSSSSGCTGTCTWIAQESGGTLYWELADSNCSAGCNCYEPEVAPVYYMEIAYTTCTDTAPSSSSPSSSSPSSSAAPSSSSAAPSSSSSVTCEGDCWYVWGESARAWIRIEATCTYNPYCHCAPCPDRDGTYDEEMVNVGCLVADNPDEVCYRSSSSSSST